MSACHCSNGGAPHDTEDHVLRVVAKQGFMSAEEEAEDREKWHKKLHSLRPDMVDCPSCRE